MQTMIFDPLEMKSCGFGPPGSLNTKVPDQPWGHKRNGQDTVALQPDPSADLPAAVGPAGTVHCSMEDWMKFLRIHLDGLNGKPSKILAVEGFKALHEPFPGQDYTPGGWRRIHRDWAEGDVLTHNGGNGANFSVAWIAPKKNMIVLSVANIGDADEPTDEVIGLLKNSN